MNCWLVSILVGVMFTFHETKAEHSIRYLKLYNPNYKVEMLNERSKLADSPYWDECHQTLYWLDQEGKTLISYNPDTEEIFKANIQTMLTPLGFAVRVQYTQDIFAVTLKGELSLVQWDGRSNTTLIPVKILDVENPNSTTSCNDGKADPANRIFVDSRGGQLRSDPVHGNIYERNKGSLYRIDYNGNKSKLVTRLQFGNGLEWSLDNKKFYFIDSLEYTIYEYEYNIETGDIRFIRDLIYFEELGLVGNDIVNSLPDGMTIDNEGMLWVALFGTTKVVRVDPRSRQVVFEIRLHQVLKPTSIVFGGRDLDIMFITSAYVDFDADLERRYPKSGYTFKITGLGVKGARASRPAKLDETIVKRCCPRV